MIWPFHHKLEPLPHVIIRHVVATKSESAKARAKREEVHAALRRYVVERQLIAAVEKAVGRP